MPPTLQQLGIDALSPADRFALAQALWESIHESLADEPVAPEVRSELERRSALADSDPERGTPWDEVRGAARSRWVR